MRAALPLLALLLLTGCASTALAGVLVQSQTVEGSPPPADEVAAALEDQPVRSTLLLGQPQAPLTPPPPPTLSGGPVSLSFVNVDVQAVARAVLTDLLNTPYSLAPDVHTPITLRTPHRIARAEVLPAFEGALRAANLALVEQSAGGYAIVSVDQARNLAPVATDQLVGYGREAIRLQFVNAEQLRRLIDPVLPGVVSSADTSSNTLTILGAEGQRRAARELIRQFDVDWLRGASFGLFIPRRTDSRLIVPELDKVLNADSAPTRNMVRLIAMDRLNGILAVTTAPQYLDDVRRWVEILDQEGESTRRRLFVYHVQNGRAADLAHVLTNVFGQSSAGAPADQRTQKRQGAMTGALPSDSQPPSSGQGPSGSGGTPGLQSGGLPASTESMSDDGGGRAQNVDADDFHARITDDEMNNAILVYASPRDYAVIEEALRKLDIPPYQVVIEAAIAEVTLTDSLQFGLQGLYSKGPTSVGVTQSATSALPIQNFPGFSALYTAKTISAALNALETITKIKVISAPKLMVLNNQTASIEVGEQVPILTGSATSTLTTGAPVVNSIDYRDTGIILKVTPRVNSSGVVLLDMAQEVSAVVSATTTATINSPTISTRKIATSVSVQDGEIIALGGLISDNRNDVNGGLPGLSHIPILGPLLFGDINHNDTRTELIVLLRPVVIRNVDDGRAVTDELRQKLKSMSGLLPSKEMP
jgi:general secretion pathway protein D